MRLKELLLALLLCGVSMQTEAQQRVERTLSEGWEFSHDGSEWKSVRVPHDWAIAGPFDKKWDLQTVAIEQNGEKVATEKSGRSGSLPWIGEGQYRTKFSTSRKGGRVWLVFDGAMSEPVVYVNGKEAGGWAYGYNTFRIDVTPYIDPKGGKNDLLVKLRNVEESSRWYPGAGLYRPVTLREVGDLSIDEWGTAFRTKALTSSKAETEVEVTVNGWAEVRTCKVVAELYDRNEKLVAKAEDIHKNKVLKKDVQPSLTDSVKSLPMSISKPEDIHPWSPEEPYLYKLRLSAYDGKKLVDQKEMKVGLRTIAVSKEHGFQLNGVSRKIKGVCLHHDLGPLGAAVNKSALIRQIRIMKEMGADAIRTSHNMPSQMQMEVCDSMGMMVMAESFDMWIYPKCKNGYARFFKEWADRDIENLVRAHRNHPSIVMWSIGNEIPEQWSQQGVEIAKRLQDLCHRLDPTRPVTQGMDRVDAALKSGFAQAMDIPGFNYRVNKYAKGMENLPQGFLLGSETASTVSSRGVYKFPVEVSNKKKYDDGQCSGYDTEYCSWSNLPEDDFESEDDLPYYIGQFVWTGFDYLGEPTPYDEYWPSRSSYFGICDLAGLPKDRYYLYRSRWNKKEHTVHLLPHWTWHGREGQVTPVYCYTDGTSAELFVNGKSMGRKAKNPGVKMDRYRIRWNDVVYEPGEIRVVAYDEKGNKIGEDVRRTAGQAKQLTLRADRNVVRADGEDLVYVTVSLEDKDGNLVPTATDNIKVSVDGEGDFEAVCNGDATSLQSFKNPEMRLFGGQMVIVVRASRSEGSILVIARDESRGLRGSVSIATEKY